MDVVQKMNMIVIAYRNRLRRSTVDKSLEILRRIKAPLHQIVNCMEKLLDNDANIVEYNKLTGAEMKSEATSSFLRAFFRYRENTKIEKAIDELIYKSYISSLYGERALIDASGPIHSFTSSTVVAFKIQW